MNLKKAVKAVQLSSYRLVKETCSKETTVMPFLWKYTWFLVIFFSISHKSFLHEKKVENQTQCWELPLKGWHDVPYECNSTIVLWGDIRRKIFFIWINRSPFPSPVSTVLWSSHKTIYTKWEEQKQSFVVTDFLTVSIFCQNLLASLCWIFLNLHEGHKQIYEISFFFFLFPHPKVQFAKSH